MGWQTPPACRILPPSQPARPRSVLGQARPIFQEAAMKVSAFERFAGLCAILAAVASFAYSVAFIVISRSRPELGGLLSALFLLLSGVLALPALLGLFLRLRAADEGFAFLGLALGLV